MSQILFVLIGAKQVAKNCWLERKTHLEVIEVGEQNGAFGLAKTTIKKVSSSQKQNVCKSR